MTQRARVIPTTLVLLIRENELLLAMKKRSYGKGNWNGVGGKVDEGETLEQAAVRETQEEINVTPKNLMKVAHLEFFVRNEKGQVEPEMDVHVFSTTVWEGEPEETEEMRPHWFKLSDIPYDNMWPDDAYWLPSMLKGQLQKGTFVFNKDYEIVEHKLTEVKSLKN